MQQQNLNLYYIFFQTASYGNISLTAKELFISQPAVSKAISKLEKNLGTALFRRSPKGVLLTPEGELLYEQLKAAFQSIEEGEEQLHSIHTSGISKLSLGVSTTLCKYILLPYLKDFMKENPRSKISISCQSSAQTILALQKGVVDIGLIGANEIPKDLNFIPLKEIHDVFVCSPDYLLNVENVDDISSLFLRSTLLLLDKSNMTRQYVDQYLQLEGLLAGQILEVTTMDLLIEFAKIGLGIACVIEDFVTDEIKNGSLIVLDMKEPLLSRQIGFAYSKSISGTHAMERFLEKAISY